jgi:transposase
MSEKEGIKAVLGIDIAKERFNVALLRGGKYKHKSFVNNAEGFRALSMWLQRQGIEGVGRVHACMESTGVYTEPLAQYLYDSGYKVSVVNPARVKGFAQSELIRTKTDKVDASVIARFCLAMRPEEWVPEAKEIRELRSLVRRVDALIKMRNQETNRLEARDDVVRAEIEDHMEYLDRQIELIKQRITSHIDRHPQLREKRDLLESIPGVGEATIGLVLSHFAYVEKFSSAKELTSFLGIAPREHQSGSSVRGRRRMSKVGRSSLRKAFYMPALAALRYNPIIVEMKRRLTVAGKPKMVIVGAAMRKLVHLIYGVLKNNTPFDPTFSAKVA